MPGPQAQERKHGRTPNSLSNGDWREYDDVPFEGAPAMPKPPGRRKSWHPMAEKTWQKASVMPHCVDWRDEEWLALEVLVYEVDLYYNTLDEKKKTTQIAQIRIMKNELGIGEKGRREQKIRYRQKVEPGLPGNGPDGALEVVDDGDTSKPAGKVVPIRDRRAAITARSVGGGQADTSHVG